MPLKSTTATYSSSSKASYLEDLLDSLRRLLNRATHLSLNPGALIRRTPSPPPTPSSASDMPCRLAITSAALGRCFAGHGLAAKLDAAHRHGYRGLELFHEDVLDVARQSFSSKSKSGERGREREGDGEEEEEEEVTEEAELAACRLIRQLCADRGITILCLQPLYHYEGLRDRAQHAQRIAKLEWWFRLVEALGVDLIQVPSNFLPEAELHPDPEVAIADLRKIADMGLARGQTRGGKPVRFVYESLAWGTRADTWEASWDVVRRVDRPNFGLCLDTFNIAGRVYADPAAADGTGTNGPGSAEAVRESVRRLVRDVDPARVFYVQVVDAERLDPPLAPGHPFFDPAQPARMSWSRNCRLFYGEQDRGGYLPVAEIASALFAPRRRRRQQEEEGGGDGEGEKGGLGFQGWVSMELFHRRAAEEDPAVPEELARRGAVAWRKLVRDFGLRVEEEEEAAVVGAPAQVRASL